MHASSIAIRMDKSIRRVTTEPGAFFSLKLYAPPIVGLIKSTSNYACSTTKVTIVCAFLYALAADHTHTWDHVVRAGLSVQTAKLLVLVLQFVANIAAAVAAPSFDPLAAFSPLARLMFGEPQSAFAKLLPPSPAGDAKAARPAFHKED